MNKAKNKKLLVIDHNEIIAFDLANCINHEYELDFHAFYATSIVEAKDLTQEINYDLLLTDICLANTSTDMSGFKFGQSWAKQFKNPVIYTTASKNIVNIIKTTPKNIIYKPIDFEILKELILKNTYNNQIKQSYENKDRTTY